MPKSKPKKPTVIVLKSKKPAPIVVKPKKKAAIVAKKEMEARMEDAAKLKGGSDKGSWKV